MAAPIQFKFRGQKASGDFVGSFSKGGAFDANHLFLGSTAVPMAEIVDVRRWGNRHVIVARKGPDGAAIYDLFVDPDQRDSLARGIHAVASRNRAEAHRVELAAKGGEARFRTQSCPCCEGTLDLTDTPASPQVYCFFCDAILTGQGDATGEERTYGLCHACGLFTQVRGFTASFYWLVLAYRMGTKLLCGACERKEAWKMLLGNVPCLLGIPMSLGLLCRAYAASKSGPSYTGLDAANALVRRKRFEEAASAYELVAQRVLPTAGVRYNQGLAMFRAERWPEAALCLERSLSECGNFLPSARLLVECYERAGREAEAASLREKWGIESRRERELAALIRDTQM